MSVVAQADLTVERSSINALEEIEPGATDQNKFLVLSEEVTEQASAFDSKEYHIENPHGIKDLTRLIRSVSVNKSDDHHKNFTHSRPKLQRAKSDSNGASFKNLQTISDAGLSLPETQHVTPSEFNDSDSSENSLHVDNRLNEMNSQGLSGSSELVNSTGSTDSQETPTASLNSDFSENQYSTVESRERSITEIEADEDFITTEAWRQKPRHVFVLTEAGKPVYTRHGSEDKLAPLMGVLLALISCVYDRKDTIRYVTAGDHKFVFMPRPPILLVGVCSTMESVHQVTVYLSYVYNTIISVLTLSQLKRIYESKKNFDLRRLLTGTEKFLNNMCTSMDQHPQFLLQAVQCLPITGNTRDIIGQALQQSRAEDLAFAILISHNQIVNICRLKEHSLHPADLHLILNLVSSSSTAFHTGESWTPICLPNFNANGFLHAHISYLDDDYSTCLLLLSADRDAFFTLSESKNRVLAKLKRHGCLEALKEAGRLESYTVKKVGISVLRHFMYKSKSTSQFTCPDIGYPYKTEEQRNRIYGLYQHTHGRIHDMSSPLKLLYLVSDSETILGWVTSGFELYAVFGPLVTKNAAISAVNHLLRWIKKQEDELFILRPPIF